jgi:hypothetical protein
MLQSVRQSRETRNEIHVRLRIPSTSLSYPSAMASVKPPWVRPGFLLHSCLELTSNHRLPQEEVPP